LERKQKVSISFYSTILYSALLFAEIEYMNEQGSGKLK